MSYVARSDELANRANSLRELGMRYAKQFHESLALEAESAAALYEIAAELAAMNERAETKK